MKKIKRYSLVLSVRTNESYDSRDVEIEKRAALQKEKLLEYSGSSYIGAPSIRFYLVGEKGENADTKVDYEQCVLDRMKPFVGIKYEFPKTFEYLCSVMTDMLNSKLDKSEILGFSPGEVDCKDNGNCYACWEILERI